MLTIVPASYSFPIASNRGSLNFGVQIRHNLNRPREAGEQCCINAGTNNNSQNPHIPSKGRTFKYKRQSLGQPTAYCSTLKCSLSKISSRPIPSKPIPLASYHTESPPPQPQNCQTMKSFAITSLLVLGASLPGALSLPQDTSSNIAADTDSTNAAAINCLSGLSHTLGTSCHQNAGAFACSGADRSHVVRTHLLFLSAYTLHLKKLLHSGALSPSPYLTPARDRCQACLPAYLPTFLNAY